MKIYALKYNCEFETTEPEFYSVSKAALIAKLVRAANEDAERLFEVINANKDALKSGKHTDLAAYFESQIDQDAKEMAALIEFTQMAGAEFINADNIGDVECIKYHPEYNDYEIVEIDVIE